MTPQKDACEDETISSVQVLCHCLVLIHLAVHLVVLLTTKPQPVGLSGKQEIARD